MTGGIQKISFGTMKRNTIRSRLVEKLSLSELKRYAHLPLETLDGYCTHRATHSSGAGGQSVNTSDTKVLSVFTPDPTIRAVSQRERSQYQNRRANLEKIRKRLVALSTPRKVRVKTKPSKAAQQRRLEAKTHRATQKRTRSKKFDDE
jgi:ribosome-associated protein